MSLDYVLLDLNDSELQQDLFELPKQQQLSVMGTLKKLSRMTWDQIYRDPGLKWEAVKTQAGPHQGRLYSFRLGKGFRAVAYRKEQWLKMLSLHPDHDSAYDR